MSTTAAPCQDESFAGAKCLFSYVDDEVNIDVYDLGEGFMLRWDDHVINEWREVYPHRSTVFARLALLFAAVFEVDGTWRDGMAEFHREWQMFAEAWLPFTDDRIARYDGPGNRGTR